MSTLSIYLTFDGNCEEAFNFYKLVFGGEFETFQRFSDMPPQSNGPSMSESELSKVMHVALPVSKDHVILGSDTGGGWSEGFKTGNNFSISFNSDNQDETDRIFNALKDGGNVTTPLEKTFWGSYFGMLTDKFGISWMVNCNLEDHK